MIHTRSILIVFSQLSCFLTAANKSLYRLHHSSWLLLLLHLLLFSQAKPLLYHSTVQQEVWGFFFPYILTLFNWADVSEKLGKALNVSVTLVHHLYEKQDTFFLNITLAKKLLQVWLIFSLKNINCCLWNKHQSCTYFVVSIFFSNSRNGNHTGKAISL